MSRALTLLRLATVNHRTSATRSRWGQQRYTPVPSREPPKTTTRRARTADKAPRPFSRSRRMSEMEFPMATAANGCV